MADITVNLNSVSPDPLNVEANDDTTITWTAGSDVATFKISNLDESVFGTTGTDGYVAGPFSVTDNGTEGSYDYTVDATAASDGNSAGSYDPRIENESV